MGALMDKLSVFLALMFFCSVESGEFSGQGPLQNDA